MTVKVINQNLHDSFVSLKLEQKDIDSILNEVASDRDFLRINIEKLNFLKSCGKIYGDFVIPSVDEVLKHEGQ